MSGIDWREDGDGKSSLSDRYPYTTKKSGFRRGLTLEWQGLPERKSENSMKFTSRGDWSTQGGLPAVRWKRRLRIRSKEFRGW